MGTKVPKPFIRLGGTPIVVHTLRRLLEYEPVCEVAIACSGDWMERVDELVRRPCEEANVEYHIVEGGEERQDSVSRALQALGDPDLVAVHDAVRPFVEPIHMRQCCRKAGENGAALLAVPVRDTLKVVNSDGCIRETPDRRKFWKAQTPQVFRPDLLREAFRKARERGRTGTDDASLVEWLGHKVCVVEGSRNNFKITYPEDLERAAQLLNKKEES